MTLHLCSCGFATDDPAWFEGHQYQHPGHHARGQPPRIPNGTGGQRPPAPAPGRPPDVTALSSGELERTRRELAASLALTRPGSPARLPIQAHLTAIDAELAWRSHARPHGFPGSPSA